MIRAFLAALFLGLWATVCVGQVSGPAGEVAAADAGTALDPEWLSLSGRAVAAVEAARA